MKNLCVLFLSTLMAALTSCGGNSSKRTVSDGPYYDGDSLGNGVYYVFKNKIMISEIPMKEKMAHGSAKEWYNDGTLRREANYENGSLEGLSTEYYETGSVFCETPYVSNKIHGVQYKYKKDGSIASEAPFENGDPVPGIKEYKEGVLIEQPTIVSVKTGKNIELRLSDNNKKAEFYMISADGKKSKIQTDEGVGKYLSNIGGTIRAVYTTPFGNNAAVDSK